MVITVNQPPEVTSLDDLTFLNGEPISHKIVIPRDLSEATDRRNAKRREKYASDHPKQKRISCEGEIFVSAGEIDTAMCERRDNRNARRRELYAIQGKCNEITISKRAKLEISLSSDDALPLEIPIEGVEVLLHDDNSFGITTTNPSDIRNARRREKYAQDRSQRNHFDGLTEITGMKGTVKRSAVNNEKRREKYAAQRDANNLINAKRREKYASKIDAADGDMSST